MGHFEIMGYFEIIDLVSVVDACTSDRAVGRCVSMAKAVEELRVLTDDFVSPHEAVANALSAGRWARFCSTNRPAPIFRARHRRSWFRPKYRSDWA